MHGLYIHIPFCRQKCHYCDFVSRPAKAETITAYLKALTGEMQKYRGLPVATVYVGGGTPSLLTPAQVKDLFAGIKHTFDCSHLSEVTIEVNPETVAEDNVRAFIIAGVNRISIGAQSFSDARLADLGRIHTAAAFEKAFHTVRYFNLKNMNIDLMYGLDGQGLDDWKKTLERVVSFHPEHLSLYPLTIEPGTVFAQRGMTVSEDRQADMYEWSMAYLETEGYAHYEISNWARPGFESQHNLIYWHNKEYAGIGVAAASYLNGRRWKNSADIDAYIRCAGAGEDVIAEQEEIDDDTRLAEEMILRLRTSAGVRITEQMSARYAKEIEEHISRSLLERSGDTLRLTRRGRMVANQVFKDFV